MVYSGTLHVSTTTSDIAEEDQLSIYILVFALEVSPIIFLLDVLGGRYVDPK